MSKNTVTLTFKQDEAVLDKRYSELVDLSFNKHNFKRMMRWYGTYIINQFISEGMNIFGLKYDENSTSQQVKFVQLLPLLRDVSEPMGFYVVADNVADHTLNLLITRANKSDYTINDFLDAIVDKFIKPEFLESKDHVITHMKAEECDYHIVQIEEDTFLNFVNFLHPV